MLQSVTADLIVILHFLFIVFVVFGGILCFHSIKWVWIHVPALIWGIFIELTGGVCPLTPLENFLRDNKSGTGYEEGFIGHYLLSIIYPDGLTRNIRIFLGFSLLAFNLLVYWAVFIRKNRKEHNRILK